jgi:hypothetical protein
MGHPSVSLAGKDYPVKPLAIRQMRVVIPAMVRLRGLRIETITEAQIDDLAEIVWQAVRTAPDSPTREEFNDLPIPPLDLMKALPVIAAQTGMAPKKDPEPGEAQAGN